MERRPASSSKPSRLLGMAIVLGLGAMIAGCPEDLPARSVYRRVAADPVPVQPKIDDATKKMHTRAKQVRDRLHVKKMRLGFVNADQQKCTEDSECTLTPVHCCNCTGNGKMTAVRADKLTQLLSYRTTVCAETTCTLQLSTHPSCSARTAVCREGKCVPNPADIAAAAKPEGVGVETIKDEAPKK